MHDVVIVGGGVAGAAVAIQLAQMGRSVVMLERAETPHRKSCGEGLFPFGVEQLERLGLLAQLRDHGSPLTALRFHTPSRVAEAKLGNHHPGLGIGRDVLDQALRGAAKAAGVTLMTGVTARSLRVERGLAVAARTSVGEVRGRVFVGADGLNSRMRRLARLDVAPGGGRYGVSAHFELDRPAGNAVDVYFHEGFEVYRTPVGERYVNIALLLERDQMSRFAGRLSEGFTELLGEHPALEGACAQSDEPLVAGPFPRRTKRAWRGNVVLAGDAAGFFDGISGDGMSTALAAAPACAASIHRYLETGSPAEFRSYDAERKRLARDADWLARLSLTLARRPALARFAVRNLERRPHTFSRLTAVSAERAGWRTLRPRDLPALLAGI